jgi:hypothetical protein
MAIKFLSLYPGAFVVADEANRLMAKIPPWATNMYLFYSIDKQRPPRIAYPKKETPKKSFPKEMLSKIMGKFCCTEEEAFQTLCILEKINPLLLEALGIDTKTKAKMKGGNNSGKKNRRISK